MILLIFGIPVLIFSLVFFLLNKPHPTTTAATTAPVKGFNTSLPAPNLPQQTKNKLELFMEAQQDSLRHQAELERDPYTKSQASLYNPLPPSAPAPLTGSLHLSPRAPTLEDTTERKVNERLKRLYAVLQTSGDPSKTSTVLTGPYQGTVPETATSSDRWQQMMANLQKKDTAPDTQMQQINQALDKLLQLQHPTTPVPVNPIGNKVAALPVTINRLDTGAAAGQDENGLYTTVAYTNGFYGLSDQSDTLAAPPDAIAAVVHATQTISSGSIVKLRLLQDIFIGRERIPANSFIFGPATIAGDRVNIQLTNAVYDGRLFPIALRVYDAVDGLEGLYVPGAINRDVVKEGVGQGVSSMGVTSFDPSLGAQAAAAGIETARTLLSRKIRLVQVTLKAGHRALLKNPETLR